MHLVGYSDRWSAAPGDTVRCFVHCAGPRLEAALVRLIHGDENPKGPGFKEEVVEGAVAGTYPGRVQRLHKGSYALAETGPLLAPGRDLTVHAWLCPTTPGRGLQGVLAQRRAGEQRGFALVIGEEGDLQLHLGDGVLRTGEPLTAGAWYFVGFAYEAASGVAHLYRAPLRFTPDETPEVVAEKRVGAVVAAPDTPLVLGAAAVEEVGGRTVARGHLNGRIAQPRLAVLALPMPGAAARRSVAPLAVPPEAVVANYDLGRDFADEHVHDRSPHGRHGRTVNRPTRGVTGPNHRGRALCFSHAPEEYAAIHFHDDDIGDAGWTESLRLQVPHGLRSGVYALRLRADGHEDDLPFVVRPSRGRPGAKVALLLPTLTYQAYANESLDVSDTLQLAPLQDMTLHPDDFAYMAENGLMSTYDRHSDGSGVVYSSILHPVLNFRPRARCRTFDAPHLLPADLHLVDWLEARGVDYDVITDHDLHADGADLLGPYRVVMTGTHPEYWTEAMLDARDAWLEAGGRLMYLGGNGFYWATALSSDGTLAEIRRFGGSRTWHTPPGEYGLSLTGEFGGIWRERGRGPHATVGVGFAAMGFDRGSPYHREEGSYDPRFAFAFEGVEGAVFGAGAALVLNHGAAGFEVDRANPRRGTPAHTVILARSRYHTDAYQLTSEEVESTTPWTGGHGNRYIGADMVFLEYPNGGAVWTTGSITWCSTLSFERYDGDTSRITLNVLQRFLEPAPI